MNHLESAFSGKNRLWRYVVMTVAVIIASNTIGAIPLLIALLVKSFSDPSAIGHFAANSNDFSLIGLGPNAGLIIMLFPFIAGLAAFILLVGPLNNRTILITINGTNKLRWKRFFISAAVWAILSAFYLFFYLKLEPANFVLNNNTASLLVLAFISVTLIPFQAAFEEVLFRGYLLQGFAVLTRTRWLPVLITSLLFGLLHAFNPEVKEYGLLIMMPQYVVFGLIFGITAILDDGIEAAMGAHAANNIFVCVMVTNKSSVLDSPALFEQLKIHPLLDFSALIIIGIIFIGILKYIFKWNAFSLLLRKVKV